MGRTIPTTRELIEELREDMMPFRRAMKPRHQKHYDALFHNINYHAMPAKQANRLDIDWLFLFTACIGQQREIEQLKERVDELEGQDG